MSYFKFYPCFMIQEGFNIDEFVKNRVLKSAGKRHLGMIKGLNQHPQNQGEKSSGWITPNAQTNTEAVKTIVAVASKLFIGHFITIFVDTKLSEFAVRTIHKHKRNKPLFDFIQNQVDNVYRKHPDYTACNAKQFMKTSIFDYFLSEWRDKTNKERAKLFAYRSIDNAISIIVSETIPLPCSSLLAVPIKMALVYCGCDIGLGSVYNIAVELDGNTLAFGVNYKPVGFTLSNILLYTFNKEGKLIANPIKDPPEKLYKITKDDANKILEKFGDTSDLSTLKKEVKRINDDHD